MLKTGSNRDPHARVMMNVTAAQKVTASGYQPALIILQLCESWREPFLATVLGNEARAGYIIQLIKVSG